MFYIAGSPVETSESELCSFPFTYKSKRYTDCIKDGDEGDDDEAWCSHEPNYEPNEKWGHCLYGKCDHYLQLMIDAFTTISCAFYAYQLLTFISDLTVMGPWDQSFF